MAPRAFDYVIVGAGSAGCTLANRLTEDQRQVYWSRGGRLGPRSAGSICRLAGASCCSSVAMTGCTRPSRMRRPGNRHIECARGKIIGGSSSINAMAYVRGNRSDYDRWASYGLPGWSYADVLPYFRRQESWESGASEFRGGSGPLTTRKSRYRDPLVEAYCEAAKEAGHPYNDDYNGVEQYGIGRMQMTIRNGRRAAPRPLICIQRCRVESFR